MFTAIKSSLENFFFKLFLRFAFEPFLISHYDFSCLVQKIIYFFRPFFFARSLLFQIWKIGIARPVLSTHHTTPLRYLACWYPDLLGHAMTAIIQKLQHGFFPANILEPGDKLDNPAADIRIMIMPFSAIEGNFKAFDSLN